MLPFTSVTLKRLLSFIFSNWQLYCAWCMSNWSFLIAIPYNIWSIYIKKSSLCNFSQPTASFYGYPISYVDIKHYVWRKITYSRKHVITDYAIFLKQYTIVCNNYILKIYLKWFCTSYRHKALMHIFIIFIYFLHEAYKIFK